MVVDVINLIILLSMYVCANNDALFKQYMCLSHSIPDPPEVMVGLTEQDKTSEFSHIVNEGDIPPSFSCFYNGDPFPYVTWTLSSGGPLPSSIKQTYAKPGILQLQFTSALAYNDPVWFVCTASNTLGTNEARLELIIRGEAGVEFVSYFIQIISRKRYS